MGRLMLRLLVSMSGTWWSVIAGQLSCSGLIQDSGKLRKCLVTRFYTCCGCWCWCCCCSCISCSWYSSCCCSSLCCCSCCCWSCSRWWRSISWMYFFKIWEYAMMSTMKVLAVCGQSPQRIDLEISNIDRQLWKDKEEEKTCEVGRACAAMLAR